MATKAKKISDPRSPNSSKGLSAKKLMSMTPKLFRNNSRDVVIKKLEKKATKTGLKAIIALAFSPDSKALKPHKQTVVGLDRDKSNKALPISKSKRVMVQCNCESYVFQGAEYANWYHGAASIIYGNGDKPVVTNPQLRPFLCKHLYKLMGKIIERGM